MGIKLLLNIGVRALRICVRVMVSLLVTITLTLLVIHLWVNGWLLSDNNSYSFRKQLVNNPLASVEYDKGALEWYFLNPEVSISNLVVSDTSYKFKSDDVKVSIDIWESLQTGDPVIKDLILNNNQIQIEVKGGNQQKFNWQDFQPMLHNAQYWDFKNSNVQITTKDDEYSFVIDDFRIESIDEFHRIVVESPVINLIAELTPTSKLASSIIKMQGDIYSEITTEGLQLLSSFQTKELVKFDDSTVKIWATISPEVGMEGFALLDINAKTDDEQSIHLPLEQINFKLQKQFSLLFPEKIDLANWSNTASKYLLASSNEQAHKIADVIKKTQLQGELSDLQISHVMGEQTELLGTINQGAIKLANETLILSNIDGHFETNLSKGYMDIDSELLSVWLKNNYSAPITLDETKGRVFWNIQLNDNQVNLETDAMTVDYHGNTGSFYLSLLTPLIRGKAGAIHDLTLKVGMNQLPINQVNQLLPFQASKQVVNYINAAVIIDSNQDKHFSDAGFVFHESRTDEYQSNFQIAAALANFDLKFMPDWPLAKSLNGKVTVNNGSVDISINNGTFMNVDSTSFNAKIDDNATQDLSITGILHGDGNDLLDTLRKTPLRENVGDTLDYIALNNAVTVNLDFKMPLKPKNAAQYQAIQRIDAVANLSKNSLHLKEADITINELSGDFNYSLNDGENSFNAKKLKGTVWEEPLSMVLSSDADKVIINLDTVFDTATLHQHFDLNVAEFITGKSALSGSLTLPLEEEATQTYSFTTMGDGIEVDLPLGFGKAATQTNQIDIQIVKRSDGQKLSIAYQSPQQATINALFDYNVNDQRQAVLTGIATQLTQQGKSAGTLESLFTPNSFAVNANLTKADQQTLITLIDRFSETSKQDVSTNESGLIIGFKPEINLSIADFYLGEEFGLRNVEATVTSDDTAWNIDFKQQLANGRLSFYYDSNSIPKAVFNQIDIEQVSSYNDSDEGNDSATPTQRVDSLVKAQPQLLPSATIVIEKLINGDADYGSLTFNMRSKDDGIVFNNIVSSLVQPIEGHDNFVDWSYVDGVHQTVVNARLTSEQLPNIINAEMELEYITSKFIAIDAQMNWQGSPSAIGIDGMEGDFNFTLKDGSFKEVPHATTVLSKIVSLVNLDNWARRLRFDFSDVTNEGTVFNVIEGKIKLNNKGDVEIVDYIYAKLPSSKIHIKGAANTIDDTIDAEIELKLPIIQNSAWLAAFLINLPAAAGVFLVSKLFSKEIENLTDVTYDVTGKLSEPAIKLKGVKKNKRSKKNKSS